MNEVNFGFGNGSLAKAIEKYGLSIYGLERNEYPRKIAFKTQGLNVYDSIIRLSNGKK